ncbi:MAG: tRNA-(ms[2]io[6]A)-hydroxylase [Flavobacteriales bacterium]|nr:tRNA-(ms[2]io[6]A)-hydroxylase [Flavobacteriales bacterium]
MEIKLKYDTPAEWAKQVVENIDVFLQDHADAERKVANMCLSLIAKYPDKRDIIADLNQIAVEELLHFKQVYDIMYKRGLTIDSEFKKDPYMKGLSSIIREDTQERLLDRLILASVAEMRGVERFKLISEVTEDQELKKFYSNLYIQEKEHVDIFLQLAERYFSTEDVESRLEEILIKEGEVIEYLPWRPAMH